MVATSLVARICHVDIHAPGNVMGKIQKYSLFICTKILTSFVISSEHDWVSCKQRCREIRLCCNTPCICVCSPPHTHDCFCGMGKDSKTQIFDAGSDWDDFDRDDDDRDEKVGPITRPRAPTRAATSTTDEEAMRNVEGVRRWQAFAQGGAVLDDYRRAGLIVGEKRPEKDVVPVELSVAAPVEGQLINFDDDDAHQEVPATEETKPPAPTIEDLLTYDGAGDGLVEAMSGLQDTLPTSLEKDLMTFEEQDDSRAEGASPGQDPLTVVVQNNDNLASRPNPADVPTPVVEEVVIPPMEGQLIELS